jgi:DNA helicase HerA-like ATPase
VPAAKQREALEFLREFAFSEQAFQAPRSLHAKLNVERLWGFDLISYFFEQRLDFPWHDSVLGVQRNVLERLMHPIVLLRIQDNELRMPEGEGPFSMAELFSSLDSAIWSELDGESREISSLRRNLQREHLKQLIRLTLRQAPAPPPPPPPAGIAFAPPPPPRHPEDATTLARFSLATLQAKIAQALTKDSLSDVTTRAHLEETQARITAVLQAQVQRPPE